MGKRHNPRAEGLPEPTDTDRGNDSCYSLGAGERKAAAPSRAGDLQPAGCARARLPEFACRGNLLQKGFLMRDAIHEPKESPTGLAESSLLIVSRDQPELFQTLLQEFGGSPQLLVLRDERSMNRRQQARAVPGDRRWQERRHPLHPEEDLRLRLYIFVRPPGRRPKD